MYAFGEYPNVSWGKLPKSYVDPTVVQAKTNVIKNCIIKFINFIINIVNLAIFYLLHIMGIFLKN